MSWPSAARRCILSGPSWLAALKIKKNVARALCSARESSIVSKAPLIHPSSIVSATIILGSGVGVGEGIAVSVGETDGVALAA